MAMAVASGKTVRSTGRDQPEPPVQNQQGDHVEEREDGRQHRCHGRAGQHGDQPDRPEGPGCKVAGLVLSEESYRAGRAAGPRMPAAELDSSLPRSRASATVWIAWNEAMASATARRNAQSSSSCPRSARGIASSIVMCDHDRHDQAEQAADQAHADQRPELAPDEGQGETDEPAQGRALGRECPVKDDARWTAACGRARRPQGLGCCRRGRRGHNRRDESGIRATGRPSSARRPSIGHAIRAHHRPVSLTRRVRKPEARAMVRSGSVTLVEPRGRDLDPLRRTHRPARRDEKVALRQGSPVRRGAGPLAPHRRPAKTAWPGRWRPWRRRAARRSPGARRPGPSRSPAAAAIASSTTW